MFSNIVPNLAPVLHESNAAIIVLWYQNSKQLLCLWYFCINYDILSPRKLCPCLNFPVYLNIYLRYFLDTRDIKIRNEMTTIKILWVNFQLG